MCLMLDVTGTSPRSGRVCGWPNGYVAIFCSKFEYFFTKRSIPKEFSLANIRVLAALAILEFMLCTCCRDVSNTGCNKPLLPGVQTIAMCLVSAITTSEFG